MKTTMTTALAVLALGLGWAPTATAADSQSHCSIKTIAGRWMFATDVGRQSLFPGQGGDITAIGTLNIDRRGALSGSFDVTVEDFAYIPDNTFTGTVTVERDCTATLTFVNSSGISRTDSIVILSRREMWGMSQDPSNLWTYRARKISRR